MSESLGTCSSDAVRPSGRQEIGRKRNRNRAAAASFRSVPPPRSPLVLRLLAAVIIIMALTYGSHLAGWRRLLPAATKGTIPARMVAHGLALPHAASMIPTRRWLPNQRIRSGRFPVLPCPRRNDRNPPHRVAAPLEVATFAFAEMSSQSSLVATTPAEAVAGVARGTSLGTFDIRCSITGRVVCERVIDLDAPEGRCIGYAVPTHPDDDQGSSYDVLEPPEPRLDNNENDAVPHSLASSSALRSPRHWIREYLHPHEVEYGMDQTSGIGRTSFLLGRLALRQALECVARMGEVDEVVPSPTLSTVTFRAASPAFADCVLLKDVHGRPNIPQGFLGSVSHKKNVAVALVARDGTKVDGSNRIPQPSPPHQVETLKHCASTAPSTAKRGIGVDLEAAAPRNKMSIARKVLTADEIGGLGSVPGLSVDEEVLLRFSIKESLYKAMHPLICQYVGFQEATVQPLAAGDVLTTLNLRSGAHERFDEVTAHWTRLGGYFLSTSSVSLPVETKGIEKS